MSSEKRDTEKKGVPGVEPGAPAKDDAQWRQTIVVADEDGVKRAIIAPLPPDGKVTEDVKQGALEYVRTLRRIDDAWTGEIDRGFAERLGDALAALASTFVVENLLKVARERFGEKELETALQQYGSDDHDATLERYRTAVYALLDEQGLDRIATLLEINVAAAVLEDFEKDYTPDELAGMPQDEYDAGFEKTYDERQSDYRGQFLRTYAKEYAEAVLNELQPGTATLEQIVGHLRVEDEDAEAFFMVATHALPKAMTSGLIHHGPLKDHEIRLKENNRDHFWKVRTELALDVPSEAVLEKQESMLLDMQRRLLQNKEQSASNLKMHLDLVDQAYRAGDEPEFVYRLDEALERQGYVRQKKGSFHHKTLHNFRQRLALLFLHRVKAWKLKNDELGDVVIARTPYWIEEERYDTHQEPLGLDVMPTGYEESEKENYSALLIRPGNWWKYARMSEYFIPIPRSILRLPTHGNGRERERMALPITYYLATYARTNQKKHAGKRKAIRVGKVLENSGIVTRDELFRMTSTQARNFRRNLLNEDGDGALTIIHDLGAFDVGIRDWDNFYKQGKGWRENFWEAQIDLLVPDLAVAKAPKKW